MDNFSVGMRKTGIVAMTVWFVLMTQGAGAQEDSQFNLDMNAFAEGESFPSGWETLGDHSFAVESHADDPENKFVTVSSRENARFGVVRYLLPADCAGERVFLNARVRFSGVSDPDRVILRIAFIKDGRLIKRTDSRPITGTSDWTHHSILIVPPPESDQLLVAGALLGEGSASFDDFHVAAEGSPYEEFANNWKARFPASVDGEFENGSKIESLPVSDNSTAAIARLGRIWGYLKYHHPTIASGQTNWDYELFRFIPEYVAAGSTQEQDALLLRWIDELGDFEVEGPSDDEQLDVRLMPDLRWISDLESTELASKLKSLRHADRPEVSYYVGFVPNVGNPVFYEETHSRSDLPDCGCRLLSLFRYWNIIAYYFPYRDLTDTTWNDVLDEFVPRFIEADDELEYRKAVMELISSVQDTHAQIMAPDRVVGEYRGEKQVPLQLRFIEGKLIVSGVVPGAETDGLSELEVGDIVHSLNGVTVEDWIADRGRYWWASNQPTKMRLISGNILRTNDDQLELAFSRNGGSQFSARVGTIDRQLIRSLQAEHDASSDPWKTLDENVGYLFPAHLSAEDIRTHALRRKIRSHDNLVIDLRCYPSQFIVFKLGELLMPEATDFVQFSRVDPDLPGTFTMMLGQKVGRPDTWEFEGKVAILVDERTQSQAEYTTMAFRVAPSTRVFGSTTAGADGNVSEIQLPGNVRTLISGIGVYTPEGKDTQRVGIIPDVEVHPTISGIRSGRDEVLEAALDWIRE